MVNENRVSRGKQIWQGPWFSAGGASRPDQSMIRHMVSTLQWSAMWAMLTPIEQTMVGQNISLI